VLHWKIFCIETNENLSFVLKLFQGWINDYQKGGEWENRFKESFQVNYRGNFKGGWSWFNYDLLP
jgi:hypothetical protein